MNKRQNKNKGFIAIISLLIIATISIIIAMTILREGVDNASLSLSSIYYENARINANICLEDTLLRIKHEETCIRNLNYSIDENEGCTTTIQWQTPQSAGTGITEATAQLSVTGTAQGFTRTFNYDLLIRKFDVNHPDGSVDYTNVITINSIEEIII